MNHSELLDFYHGWMIEIKHEQDGFRVKGCSPSRQKFSDRKTYDCSFQALKAGRQVIDCYLTYQLLADFCREMYEAESISFEEWRSLSHSLIETLKSH